MNSSQAKGLEGVRVRSNQVHMYEILREVLQIVYLKKEQG